LIITEGISLDDVDSGATGEPSSQLREASAPCVSLLTVAARSLFGPDGQKQRSDTAGGIEDGRVGCDIPDMVPHGTNDAR
jgi:hypothetical protein